jgi:hypothetical protein
MKMDGTLYIDEKNTSPVDYVERACPVEVNILLNSNLSRKS